MIQYVRYFAVTVNCDEAINEDKNEILEAKKNEGEQGIKVGKKVTKFFGDVEISMSRNFYCRELKEMDEIDSILKKESKSYIKENYTIDMILNLLKKENIYLKPCSLIDDLTNSAKTIEEVDYISKNYDVVNNRMKYVRRSKKNQFLSYVISNRIKFLKKGINDETYIIHRDVLPNVYGNLALGKIHNDIFVFTNRYVLEFCKNLVAVHCDGKYLDLKGDLYSGKQFFTIMGVFCENGIFYNVLIACALVPGKTEKHYTELFTIIKDLKLFKPKLFIVDFEVAIRNSIKKVYPDSEVRGCYFHYKHNIQKKIFLLSKKYVISNICKNVVSMLPFVTYPCYFLTYFVKSLKNNSEIEGDLKLYIYVYDTYIIKLQSYFMQDVEKYISRTNNVCESLNSKLENQFVKKTINELIYFIENQFKKEISDRRSERKKKIKKAKPLKTDIIRENSNSFFIKFHSITKKNINFMISRIILFTLTNTTNIEKNNKILDDILEKYDGKIFQMKIDYENQCKKYLEVVSKKVKINHNNNKILFFKKIEAFKKIKKSYKTLFKRDIKNSILTMFEKKYEEEYKDLNMVYKKIDEEVVIVNTEIENKKLKEEENRLKSLCTNSTRDVFDESFNPSCTKVIIKNICSTHN